VRAYGAKGDGANDDTQCDPGRHQCRRARERCRIGRGRAPAGRTYKITSTLNINASNIALQGYGALGDYYTAAVARGTYLKWAGAASGTMLSVSAINGASNPSLKRPRILDLSLDCNGSAGVGLQIKSVMQEHSGTCIFATARPLPSMLMSSRR